jgi:hypothetical protein
MSDSTEIVKRTLRVRTEIPTAEIFAIDGDGDVVGRGVGTLSEKLTPGVYKIRYRIGSRVVDDFVELPPGDGDHSVPVPELPVTTSVPLSSGSTGAWPAFAEAAIEWSKQVHVKRGTGSRVFLFVNRAVASETSLARAADALTLRGFSGDEIARLSDAPSTSRCVGYTVELDPGGYLLRFDDGSSPAIEQSVFTAPSWQTQVFLPLVTFGDKCEPDFSERAVLMSSIEAGFVPNWPAFRSTAAARHSLAFWRRSATSGEAMKAGVQKTEQSRKSAVEDRLLGELLQGKFENPMLGIFGAHLMLLLAQPDLTLLRKVISNLRGLIGDHPDVTSLSLYLKDSSPDQITFPLPPMLRSSWSLIVENCGPSRPELVPTGSYSYSIGGGLWGSGAWLSWKSPPPSAKSAVPKVGRVDWNSLLDFAANSGLLTQQRLERVLGNVQLTPVQRTVFDYLVNAAKRLDLAKSMSSEIDRERKFGLARSLYHRFVGSELEKETKKSTAEFLSLERLSAATGIPYSAIADAAAGLRQKLGIDRALSATGVFANNVWRGSQRVMLPRGGLSSRASASRLPETGFPNATAATPEIVSVSESTFPRKFVAHLKKIVTSSVRRIGSIAALVLVLENAVLAAVLFGIMLAPRIGQFLAAGTQQYSVKSLALISPDDRQMEIWGASANRLKKWAQIVTQKPLTDLNINPDGKTIFTTGEPGVSPDKKSLALVSNRNSVEIWTASEDSLGKLLQFKAKGTVGGLAFSPDSKLLASVSDRDWVEIRPASKDSPQKLVQFKAPSPIEDLKFSPDGNSIITSGTEGAWLFDVRTGSLIKEVPRS